MRKFGEETELIHILIVRMVTFARANEICEKAKADESFPHRSMSSHHFGFLHSCIILLSHSFSQRHLTNGCKYSELGTELGLTKAVELHLLHSRGILEDGAILVPNDVFSLRNKV